MAGDRDEQFVYREFAPAKINLTLEIAGRRADDYHDLTSLVAFAADVGDIVTLTPGPALSLETTGAEAAAIDGTNLIVRVADALAARHPALRLGHFHLEKHLPVASGIGGGSADTAAALRAIARSNAIADPESHFAEIAQHAGADIPVCIGAQGAPPTAAFMSGTGERVFRPSGRHYLPDDGFGAILVNPRIAVATAQVFRELGAGRSPAAPAAPSGPPPPPPPPFESRETCLAYIAQARNDLEAPARRIAPVIGDVLATLAALPGCRLARMSGSGATCFGLFDTFCEAKVGADIIRAQAPSWWIAETHLS